MKTIETNNYTKEVYNKMHNEKIDALSLKNLRKSGQDTMLEILDIRKQFEEEKKQVLNSEKYSQEYRLKKVQDMTDEFDMKKSELISAFIETFNKTISAKKQKLDEMLTSPPSQEQLNVLMSLQIRKDSLTQGELERIALNFTNNYNAIKALQAIAADAGYNLIIPEQLDYDKLYESIIWTEDYIKARIGDMSLSWQKMSPLGRMFFGTAWEDNVYSSNSVEILDAPYQMATPVVTKESLSDTEKAIIEKLFDDTSGDELEGKVKTIAAKSESLRDMIRKHPTYGTFLENEK